MRHEPGQTLSRTFRRRSKGPDSLERVERVDIDPSEATLLSAIERELQQGRYSLLGEGNAAHVVALDRDEQAHDPAPWVIKKIKIKPGVTSNELHTSSEELIHEMEMQELAFRLVEHARIRTPEKPFASVPRPIALLIDEAQLYMVMDRIPGETLYDRAARVWLRQFFLSDKALGETYNFKDFDNWPAKKVWDIIKGETFVFALPGSVSDNLLGRQRGTPRMFFDLASAARNSDRDTVYPIVTPEQTAMVANTVECWNGAGFLHRDLHGANVMMHPDGHVSILDFGTSKFIDPHRADAELERRAERRNEITADLPRASDTDMVRFLHVLSRPRDLEAIKKGSSQAQASRPSRRRK